jgi:hypothetical protein
MNTPRALRVFVGGGGSGYIRTIAPAIIIAALVLFGAVLGHCETPTRFRVLIPAESATCATLAREYFDKWHRLLFTR